MKTEMDRSIACNCTLANGIVHYILCENTLLISHNAIKMFLLTNFINNSNHFNLLLMFKSQVYPGFNAYLLAYVYYKYRE